LVNLVNKHNFFRRTLNLFFFARLDRALDPVIAEEDRFIEYDDD